VNDQHLKQAGSDFAQHASPFPDSLVPHVSWVWQQASASQRVPAQKTATSNIEGTLAAAGASFPAAIYQRWFSDLAPQGIQVNYQSVGSGAGVRQFTAGTVDFGASDKPMKPEAIAQSKSRCRADPDDSWCNRRCIQQLQAVN
jgi:ABC-type phosphate transport system substrate-binding protein